MNDNEVREIRKRFRAEKNNISCIRGCFINEKKEIVTQFSQSLTMSSAEEAESLLAVIRKSLSGGLGTNLIDIKFKNEQVMGSDEHGLLTALRNSSLKDDNAVTEFFYRTSQTADIEGNYVILLASDTYDVFSYSGDGVRSDSADGTYAYIICAICPVKKFNTKLSFHAGDNLFHTLSADTILSSPEIGFLFPSFDDRRANIYNALYYTKDTSRNHENFVNRIFNTPLPMPADVQKETFGHCLHATMSDKFDFDMIKAVHEEISDIVEEYKNSTEEEPLTLSKNELKNVLKSCGADEESVEAFGKKCDEEFGENMSVVPQNIVDIRKFEVKMPDVSIKVNPECSDLISAQTVNGTRYIMIRADENVEVNGVSINIKERK